MNRRQQNEHIIDITKGKHKERRNFTLKEFMLLYSGKWFEGGECHICHQPYHDPLKNFTDCFIDLGITGDPELTKTCEEYQEIVQKLWGMLSKHGFEFKGIE